MGGHPVGKCGKNGGGLLVDIGAGGGWRHLFGYWGSGNWLMFAFGSVLGRVTPEVVTKFCR